MNELRILINRLGWPSTSARWWTIQELAGRLGESAVRIETESALLRLLRSRNLEAEVVEVLYIFWIAAKKHEYKPTIELTKNILKPSLLSELLMSDLGLAVQANDPGLKAAPADFKIPDDFHGVQGIDLPKIFQTVIKNLGRSSGFPFIRQMAFEWAENREAYPDAPFQGDLSYFVRPLGRGFVGQLSGRAALRVISAYLRTLAVAKKFWGMPADIAHEKALVALPIHPTLAMLRPDRPDWFPTSLDFEGNTQVIEAAVRALLSRVEAARSGDELIAFHSPIRVSMEQCIELSIVRWSQDPTSSVDDSHLADHLDALGTNGPALTSSAAEPIGAATTVTPPPFDQLVDEDCNSWPLAATLDFDRMGYLQHDLYPSRLYFPTMPSSKTFKLTPNNGMLEAKVEDQVIADFYYWNVGWGYARPRQLSGNCGTALISHGNTYREGAHSVAKPMRAFYLWQVRTLYRSNNFEEFSKTIKSGIIFV